MQVYKFLFILCFALFSQTVISQEDEKNEQSFIVGLGSSIELEDALFGINGRLYYGVNESFCFGPEVSYFPYQSIDKDYEKSIVDLNLNAHYIFELGEKIGFYPLSGINYTIEKEKSIHENNHTERENEFGINYGLGMHYKLNDLFIFSEFKGVIGSLNDEFFTIGLIYSFYN